MAKDNKVNMYTTKETYTKHFSGKKGIRPKGKS